MYGAYRLLITAQAMGSSRTVSAGASPSTFSSASVQNKDLQ